MKLIKMIETKWFTIDEVPNLFHPKDVKGESWFEPDPNKPGHRIDMLEKLYLDEFGSNPNNVLFALRLAHYYATRARNTAFRSVLEKANIDATNPENIRVFYLPLLHLVVYCHSNTDLGRYIIDLIPPDIGRQMEGYLILKELLQKYEDFDLYGTESFLPIGINDLKPLLNSNRFILNPSNWRAK